MGFVIKEFNLTELTNLKNRNALSSDIIPVVLLLMVNNSAYLNISNIPITGGNNF